MARFRVFYYAAGNGVKQSKEYVTKTPNVAKQRLLIDFPDAIIVKIKRII